MLLLRPLFRKVKATPPPRSPAPPGARLLCDKLSGLGPIATNKGNFRLPAKLASRRESIALPLDRMRTFTKISEIVSAISVETYYSIPLRPVGLYWVGARVGGSLEFVFKTVVLYRAPTARTASGDFAR